MPARSSRRVADEQAALRRVATLIARGAPPAEVFAAVAEEIGALFGADITSIVRFEGNEDATFMGGHGVVWREQGTRFKPYPGTAVASVRATVGRATRLAPTVCPRRSSPRFSGPRESHSAVNAPVVVESTIWGTVGVASRRGRLPVDTEQRLAGFTELVATAIANTQARTELRGFADEQAALRRVACRSPRCTPEEVFAAVAAEVTRVIDVDVSFLSRYARDGTATVVAVSALPSAVPAGTKFTTGPAGRSRSSCSRLARARIGMRGFRPGHHRRW